MPRPSFSHSVLGWALFFCAITGAYYTSVGCGADPIRSPLKQPRLLLSAGEFVSGEIRESDQPARLKIQSPLFTAPFNFSVDKIEKLEFPQPAVLPKARGEYCLELSNGDLFFGKLLKLSPETLEVESETLGALTIPSPRLRRIARWDGVSELIYMGPNGLTGWEKLTEGIPKEEGGILLLDQERSAAQADVGLPDKALIECEISWKGTNGRKPEFSLSFGVKDDASVTQAFGIEVWENDVVARRETSQEADVSPLAEVRYGTGRLRLLIYLDQIGQRMTIFSPEGKQLADVRVKGATSTPGKAIRLQNRKGEVRLEQLRISRWTDEPVAVAQSDKPRIHRSGGSIVYGIPIGYNAITRKFLVREEKKETEIEADKIINIHLPAAESKAEEKKEGIKPAEEKTASDATEMRLVFQNGTRISGRMMRVKEGRIAILPTGASTELSGLMTQLQLLTVLRKETTESKPGGNQPFLIADGLRLRGAVQPTEKPKGSESVLSWNPALGEGAVPFQIDASGRIVYREKSSPSGNTSSSRPQAGAVVIQGGVVMRNGPVNTRVRSTPSTPTYRPLSLYLRTGDTIPCRVTRIDEKGVFFDSTVTQTKFIPNDKIKALELARLNTVVRNSFQSYNGMPRPSSNDPRLDTIKRDRLLTLPRMQRGNPPTHLIVATNRDVLRGRVVGLDEQQLQVELRLENREIPRDRISQIIWLHADELEDKSAKPAETKQQDNPKQTRVHAIRTDGNRLTFVAEKLEGDRLTGTNEVLGPCMADFSQLEELLLGGEIDHAATQLAYQQWKLHYAEEPLIAPEEGDSENPPNRTGLESSLVGKPAPEINLDQYEKGRFTLSSQSGKVVILDFWASWCGPCMQTIPQVHAVAQEFRDQGVELVGINLEETPRQVTGALERLKLKMQVAMDKDGKVGGKYGVTSIPKTVIIDREGKVARVYVGGHGGFDKELREALKTLLEKKTETTPAKP